jgi:hypothetical protein
MDLTFFTDPRFLSLLRFWESRRGGDEIPVWHDGLTETFPAEIAPYMIVARNRKDDGLYLYVGAACVDRFGLDPTGLRVSEFLRGPMQRYVLDVANAARQHRAPVYSYCLYHLDDQEPIQTARVFAPFAPDIMVTLQLYEASGVPLARYRIATFEEISRKRIATGGDGLRKLDQAARFHRLGRRVHVAAVANELAAAARAFDAEATLPLPVLRDAGENDKNEA